MAATLMVADLVLRGGGPRDVAYAGATAIPGSGRSEREKMNSSQDRMARTPVSGLLAQWVRAADSRDRGPGFEPRGVLNSESVATRQLRGTGALRGKPSVPRVNKWPRLSQNSVPAGIRTQDLGP